MSGRLLARVSKVMALSAAVVGFAACSANNNGAASVETSQLNGGIIGGQVATGTEDFAKTVVLLYDKGIGAMCTASIISDHLLVTAAHCVSSPAKDLVVAFGTDISSTNLIVRPVVSTETTPIWPVRQNQTLNTGDLALVAFVGGLPTGYKAARMLGDISQLKDGDIATLAGYGEADGVTGKGAGQLRSVDIAISKVDLSQTEILFDQSGGKGACHGDSGGPAYVTIKGVRYLVGVTSRGVDQCKSDSIYTNIPYYAAWIVREAKVLTAKAVAIEKILAEQQAPAAPEESTRSEAAAF